MMSARAAFESEREAAFVALERRPDRRARGDRKRERELDEMVVVQRLVQRAGTTTPSATQVQSGQTWSGRRSARKAIATSRRADGEPEERCAVRDLVEDLPVAGVGSPPASNARRSW